MTGVALAEGIIPVTDYEVAPLIDTAVDAADGGAPERDDAAVSMVAR